MKNILFGCTANICRSPFADRALRIPLIEKRVAKVEVHSAGVNALPGLSPPSEAIQIAGDFSVDVSEHISRPFSIDMIRKADIILVMDLYHIEKILEMEPEAEDKTKLLGNYSTFRRNTPEEMEIPDPYGLTLFHYRLSFNIILDCINNLYKELFET